MCHLAPYAKNIMAKNKTELTEYFGEMKMAVDFLNFKVNYYVVLSLRCFKAYPFLVLVSSAKA